MSGALHCVDEALAELRYAAGRFGIADRLERQLDELDGAIEELLYRLPDVGFDGVRVVLGPLNDTLHLCRIDLDAALMTRNRSRNGGSPSLRSCGRHISNTHQAALQKFCRTASADADAQECWQQAVLAVAREAP
jgi:hypothetical protein